MRSITTDWNKLGHFATKRDESWKGSRGAAMQMGEFRSEDEGNKAHDDFKAACARYKANKERTVTSG